MNAKSQGKFVMSQYFLKGKYVSKFLKKSDKNTDFGKLQVDVNDTNSTQESSFLGGLEANYERYNRNGHWYDREKWADVLREGSHNM